MDRENVRTTVEPNSYRDYRVLMEAIERAVVNYLSIRPT